jgi:hypothetical protein
VSGASRGFPHPQPVPTPSPCPPPLARPRPYPHAGAEARASELRPQLCPAIAPSLPKNRPPLAPFRRPPLARSHWGPAYLPATASPPPSAMLVWVSVWVCKGGGPEGPRAGEETSRPGRACAEQGQEGLFERGHRRLHSLSAPAAGTAQPACFRSLSLPSPSRQGFAIFERGSRSAEEASFDWSAGQKWRSHGVELERGQQRPSRQKRMPKQQATARSRPNRSHR